MKIDVELSVYVVRNKDGQFFRAKGYGGYGDTWVDEISKCKIYPKIGSARRMVTWFANHFPKYDIPDLVELKISEGFVLDEADRVQKSQDKKKVDELNREIWKAERKLKEAEREIEKVGKKKAELNEAREKLEQLKSQK